MKLKMILLGLPLACLCLFSGCKNDHSKDSADKVVKVSINSDPQTLDPRTARSVEAVTPLQMLYEGLMRADAHGRPQPGLAEKFTLSEDMKTYTFYLRKSYWSNGDPMTAHDFIETWKDILNPDFPSPNAYQFYVIKGAKDAKEGKIPFEETGFKAPNAQTIVIELVGPTPYFLELLTTHFFFPVHRQHSTANPISNGPFKLEQWQKHQQLSIVKNPKYWDAEEVTLNKIIFLPLDEHTALRMFENGELQWVGSPLGTIPQDAVKTLRHRHQLRILAAAGTHWIRINTGAAPLQSVKLRQALAYALDRKSIVEHVTQGNQRPATALIPPFFGVPANSFFKDNDVPMAWYAFQDALKELDISKDDIPAITLCYGSSERNHKIAQAVQQQWKKALGIDVKLESCEPQVLYDRLSRHNYQIAMGGWFADFRDPISFLEVFKYKHNSTNNTQWENKDYIKKLNLSAHETDSEKRYEILQEAEAILMQNLPVIPLYYGAFNYVKSENLFGVYFSELGYLDFKYAFYGE